MRKRVRAYPMSEHEYNLGSNIGQTARCPQTNTELVVEFDARWAHDLAASSAHQDWPAAARRMLVTMT